MDKIVFTGKIISIQPRISLTRSFDESSHTYLGYAIKLEGDLMNSQNEGNILEDPGKTVFSLGIGPADQIEYQFRVNNVISGECMPVSSSEFEQVEYYKASKLKVITEGEPGSSSAPWELVPPELDVYQERGRRRLAARTYDAKCISCMWAAMIPVEILIDHWNSRSRTDYRFETFCYGPLSCKLYKAGAKRKVEGRKGMVWIEDDWVDEMAVEHRDPDE